MTRIRTNSFPAVLPMRIFLPWLMPLLCFLPFAAHAIAPASSNRLPEVVLQTGHALKVSAVALSPDNQLLASGSADATVRLWDTRSGFELRSLTGHSGWVNCVTFSSDGRLLASGSNDKSVKIWDVSNGREMQSLEGHLAPIEALALNNDGRLLASGSADNSVRLWDLGNARAVKVLSGHTGWVTSVAFSPDNKWLATGSKDNTVRLWEVETGREVRTLTGHPGSIRALSFNGKGDLLASGSADGTIKLWKTLSGSAGKSFKVNGAEVIALTFSDDGHELLSGSSNKVVNVWDVASGRELRSAGDSSSLDAVQSMAFSSDRQSFVASADKSIILCDSATAKEVRTFRSRSAGYYAIALSANGRWLAAGGKDRTIRLWDIAAGRQLPALVGHTGYVTSLAFSKDGNLLASGSLDRTVRLWDTSTGHEVRKLTGHLEAVEVLALSPDGRWLVSGSADSTLRIWDVSTGTLQVKLSNHSGEVTAVDWSADGKWIASGSFDNTMRIWDAANWTQTREIRMEGPLTAVAFSPDNKWLAATGNNQPVQLFEVAAGGQAQSLPVDSGQVRAMVFSPDSRSIATARSDRTVKIWNNSDPAKTKVLRGHSERVTAVAYSSDGKSIVTGSEDGSLIVWDAETGSRLATLMSFSESDEWLTVTPDGLFDGSPAAWNQILWRFANDTRDVKPVEVFFTEFYYPGLLAEIFAGKTPKAVADISQKDRRQPQIRLSLAEASQRADVINVRNLAVKIEVMEATPDKDHRAGGGVRDVRLFRNGSLVKVWHGDLALDNSGRAVLETTLPIIAGANVLTSYAFNRDNIKSTDATLSVAGAAELKRRSTEYILVAGVNQYSNSAFNLRYAVPDALDFGDELHRAQQRVGSFSNIIVVPLLDSECTKSNLLFALQRLAEGDQAKAPAGTPAILQNLNKVQPEDGVVIYFAGHGTTSPAGRFYLIPHDLGYIGPRSKLNNNDRQSILEHSISDLEMLPALEGIDAGQFLLVIDACNAGQVLESEEKRRGPMNSKGLAQLAYEKGMHILTAAQSYQAALEQRRLGHGYLTYALVEEGLKTLAADTRPKDSQVQLSEWLDYAVNRVPLMQSRSARDTQGRLLEQDDDATAAKKPRDVQRPRVFYRSGAELTQMIIARP